MRDAIGPAALLLGNSWRAAGVLLPATFVFSALTWIIGPAYAATLRWLTDDALGGRSPVVAALLLGLLWGSSYFADRFSELLRLTIIERSTRRLEDRLLRVVGGVSTLELFERPDLLDRVATFRSQSRYLGNTVALLQVGAMTCNVLFSAFLLVSVDARLLVLPLCALPTVWLYGRREQLIRAAERAGAGDLRRRSRLFQLATSPDAAKEVRILRLGESLIARHRTASDRYVRLRAVAELRGGALVTLSWLIYGLGFAVALAFLVDGVFRGGVSAGAAMMVVVLATQVTWSVLWMVGSLVEARRALAAAGQFLAIEAAARAIDASRGVGPAPDRLADGIRLRGVDVRYPGTDRDALRRIDLAIPAGSTVAVVGENGAGKTTLVKVLCGLIRPTAGDVLVDDRSLGSIDPEAWRARTSGAFQDFARFEFRLGQSVGVGDVAFVDAVPQVEAALARAGGSALPAAVGEGLRTQLGTSWGGADLSLGQWQTVALGRSMMRESPLLLVLDEPTASLDAEAEQRLFARFAEATSVARSRGAIAVLVSHRFSTVRMADLIVVLDRGEVREIGSHASLMEAGGLYAELFAIQARGYR